MQQRCCITTPDRFEGANPIGVSRLAYVLHAPVLVRFLIAVTTQGRTASQRFLKELSPEALIVTASLPSFGGVAGA